MMTVMESGERESQHEFKTKKKHNGREKQTRARKRTKEGIEENSHTCTVGRNGTRAYTREC